MPVDAEAVFQLLLTMAAMLAAVGLWHRAEAERMWVAIFGYGLATLALATSLGMIVIGRRLRRRPAAGLVLGCGGRAPSRLGACRRGVHGVGPKLGRVDADCWRANCLGGKGSGVGFQFRGAQDRVRDRHRRGLAADRAGASADRVRAGCDDSSRVSCHASESTSMPALVKSPRIGTRGGTLNASPRGSFRRLMAIRERLTKTNIAKTICEV